MYNKIIKLILCILCTIGLVGCDFIENIRSHTKIELSNGNITIFDDVKQSVSMSVSIGSEFRYPVAVEMRTNNKISILKILGRIAIDYPYDIAWLLFKNDGNIDLNLRIPHVLDTTFTYHVDLNNSPRFSATVLQGKCARLSHKCDAENIEDDIIKWLYHNKKGNLGEDKINNIRLYIETLYRSFYDEYITTEEIPVIKSFKGINYQVSSNLIADNYYLFACNAEQDISEFVEEMISIKFEGAVHSVDQPLSCYRSKSTSGTTCIFLIGITNDWKYKVEPVGLVCIDNIKPSSNPIGIKPIYNMILEKHNIKIDIPSNAPTGSGFAYLSTLDWSGNSVSSPVNFSVLFKGDVKTITLKREGNLAKWLGSATKTIDLQKESSPYIFTFELHLEDGDNYVPIVITDIAGNTTEFKYNVGCKITRDNTPSINIDNDINVWE